MSKRILFVFLFLFFLVFSNAVYAGIGVSPGTINFDKMTRGGYAERTVYVSNPSEGDISISAGAEGDIKDWLKVESGIIVKGKESYQLKIMITPPSDVPNGNYEGYVLVMGSPVAETGIEGSGAQVVSAVMIRANIEVTDKQIVNFDIRGISVLPAEECRPIYVRANLVSMGNIRTKGDFHVDIFDEKGDKKLQEADYSTEEMLPTKEYNFNIEVPYELEQFKCIPEGKYKANVTFEVNDEIKDNRMISFDVAKRGTYSVSGELFDIEYPLNASAKQIVEIKAKFKNLGNFPVKAKLMGKVYLKEELIEIKEGEIKEVNAGSTDDLVLYFTPSSPGKYKINLYARFEDKDTKAEDIYIDVKGFIISKTMGMIILAVIILVVVWFLIKRKKETKDKRK